MLTIISERRIKTQLLVLSGLGLSLLVGGSSLAWAAQMEGVTLPEQTVVSGKTLKLNGIGVRKATIFNVKVYVGGLYLETPTQNAEEILHSNGLKHIQMQFVRGVDAKKIHETWDENFKNNCASECEKEKSNLAQLKQFLSDDVKKNDLNSFDFYPNRVDVFVNTLKKGSIQGASFAKIMLESWIGPKVMDKGVRSGMLGVK